MAGPLHGKTIFIDDEVLAAEGIDDLEQYSYVAGAQLIPDLYVEP
jgi:hypothetical protein